MRGSGPYGDNVHRLSDAKDYVKPGMSPLSRQGHRKMDQHLDDEYPSGAGGYPGDRMYDSGRRAETERARRKDVNDLPTLRKSRAKLSAEFQAPSEHDDSEKAKTLIINRLTRVQRAIDSLESGRPIAGRMSDAMIGMPRDKIEEMAMLIELYDELDSDLLEYDDSYDGTYLTKSDFQLELEEDIARLQEEIRQGMKMPHGTEDPTDSMDAIQGQNRAGGRSNSDTRGYREPGPPKTKVDHAVKETERGHFAGSADGSRRGMVEATMANITHDVSKLGVDSLEGAKIPRGKGASTRRRDMQDYPDEESGYQPRGSRHGHQLPPGGHRHPGLEDYADEGSHYKPRGSHHGGYHPLAGHGHPGVEDYADEESDYQPRTSRHGRYPPPAGHGRRAGR